MTKIKTASNFLIGFSYTLLLYNKIYFGVTLLVGLFSLFFLERHKFKFNFVYNEKQTNIFFFLTLILFFVSSILSIKPDRSFEVIFYFIAFILININFLKLLINNEESFNEIIKFFVISTILNITVIFFYDLYQSGFLSGSFSFQEIRKYKGVLNIVTIFVILLFFFKRTIFFVIPLLFLFPSLYISNSNAPLLGIFLGLILCAIYFFIEKIKKKKFIIITLSLISLLTANIFIKNLPNKFDANSINTQKFTIPINILDAHRQFIWGFTISKIKEKPILGFGPDTSNFIEGGQKIINSEHTGTMKFVPSHPHNFLLELLLETGLLGTLSFLIFIFLMNYNVFKKANYIEKFFIIFFNGYYWGASFVNFSYWQAWWQCSYFLILSLITAHIFHNSNKVQK